MKNLIVAAIIGLVLFGLSFAGSSFLLSRQQQEEKVDEEDAEGADTDAEEQAKDQPQQPKPGEVEVPVPIKPDTLTEEYLLQLAESMAAREENLKRREEEVKKNSQRHTFMLKDIQREKQELIEMQKQVELKILEADKLFKNLQQTKAEIEQAKADMEAMQTPAGETQSQLDKQSAQKVAETLSGVPPETIARWARKFADDGDLDVFVEYLAELEGKNAAKILDAINEPALAKQVLDLLSQQARVAQQPAVNR